MTVPEDYSVSSICGPDGGTVRSLRTSYSMKMILGKKVNMTRIYQNERAVPVTVIEAGPCTVTQVKTTAKEGHEAVQLGFGIARHTTKPAKGHTKGAGPFRWMREFRLQTPGDLAVGATVTVAQFAVGDKVHIVGTSKGKGFQGVVKRHGFRGGPASHGHKDNLRMPGSIGGGGRAGGRVAKGMRMAGHMGHDRVTVRNLEVVGVDAEKNHLLVRGAVPGARNSLVQIRAVNT